MKSSLINNYVVYILSVANEYKTNGTCSFAHSDCSKRELLAVLASVNWAYTVIKKFKKKKNNASENRNC